MAGKQAKVLSTAHIDELLDFADTTRHPERNRVLVLLSVKAGLRAGEIANLTWEMVLSPDREVGHVIALHDAAAKKKHGRRIPMHPQLHDALQMLKAKADISGPVIKSERGGFVKAISVIIWFSRTFQTLGFDGCSSHSGRRTFITKAARIVHKAGGSLRDVQLLAGHRSIQTTQRYIDGDSDAQRKLVSLI